MADKPLKDAKTFDVAKPVKSAAPATPAALVTNRPVLSDSGAVDVSGDEAMASGEVKPQPAATGGHLKIQPLNPDTKPESDTPPANSNEETATDNSKDSSPVVNDSIDDDADDTATRGKAPNAEDEDLAAKRAAERQAQLDKIAEARTYYLPINQVVRRRSRHVAAAGLVLIVCLGIAWADVALDAGLITIPGVKAPTHFFDK